MIKIYMWFFEKKGYNTIFYNIPFLDVSLQLKKRINFLYDGLLNWETKKFKYGELNSYNML
jgi:hypothetical protein